MSDHKVKFDHASANKAGAWKQFEKQLQQEKLSFSSSDRSVSVKDRADACAFGSTRSKRSSLFYSIR